MNRELNNSVVIDFALDIGFDLVGFAKAEILNDEILLLKSWLKNNFHAGMNYMTVNIDRKKNVANILPDAKTVISLGLNYYIDEDFSDLPPNAGKVSRYAWGKDYHFVMSKMLNQLIIELKKIDNNFQSIAFVDSGPLMDKVWAVKAGLGWLGKHTNIINKQFGSWFFIGNIICNHQFEFSTSVEDFCGSCNACVDACPTNAIVAPYVLDSNKCISYQTIENKGDIPVNLKNKFENWVFGCDICQDVCPWNHKFSQPAKNQDFKPVNKFLSQDSIYSMEQSDFNQIFKLSPIKRSKLNGIKRNLRFIGL
jgi:epoxyqueuosine reductase